MGEPSSCWQGSFTPAEKLCLREAALWMTLHTHCKCIMIMSYRRAHCNYFDNSRGKQVIKLILLPLLPLLSISQSSSISLFLSENFSLKRFNQQEQNTNILLEKNTDSPQHDVTFVCVWERMNACVCVCTFKCRVIDGRQATWQLISSRLAEKDVTELPQQLQPVSLTDKKISLCLSRSLSFVLSFPLFSLLR